MANFNWTFVNTEGTVAVNSVSASSFVSASTFHGDGSGLTGITGEWDGSLTGNATIIGNVSASLGLTGSSLRTATTIIDSTHVSSSLNISGAVFYGDGSALSGISAGAITTYNTSGDNRIITSVDSSTVQGEASLTFDGSKLSAVGQISASLGVTGSSVQTLNTVIDTTHVSSSLNLSASAFYGDGSTLSGIINSYANSGNNRIITSVDAASINAEADLTFDGDDLSVASSTASRPRLFITNRNADENPSQIIFNKTSSSPAENDTIGRMVFQSYDSVGNPTVYGQIEGDIKKPNSGAERGRIKLTVAEFDGTLTEGLMIQGSNTDGIVDILVSNGSLLIKDLNAAGTTPSSGFGGLYVNGDNLYFVNDSGTSTQLNSGGGGSTAYNSFTANYTVTTDHDIMGIITTGSAITASLASAATYAAGQKFIFKDVSGSCSGSNHIVISASQNHVGQNIDGQGILKIQSGYGSITLASDGVASFYIIGTN